MKIRWLCAISLGAVLCAACAQEQPAVPTPATNQPQITEVSSTPAEIVLTDTPAPTPTHEPRTLTICTGDEPDTLYIYGGSMFIAASIQEAIYDGPIDTRGYSYQPIILEKIPSLADGDAVVRQVSVGPGEFLIDSTDAYATLHEGVTYRPSGCRSGDCAQTYSGSDPVIVDQMVVTFTWKTGITWSDGVPLTAADSVYSYELDAALETPTSKYLVNRTASYTSTGPNTTVWTGEPGFINPAYFLAFWHPLPQHLWSEYSAGELIEAEISARAPVGWGPYVIEEWVVGSHIRLHRNPFYHRAAEGLPHFDTLIFRIFGENPTGATAALMDGSCDIANITTHLDGNLRDLISLDLENALQLYTVTGTAFEHLDFGILPSSYDDGYQPTLDRPDYFGDVRTRQAIAFCLDRDRMVEEIYFGKSEIPASYIPTIHPLFNAEAPGYAHNPEAGRSLLDEVGWLNADGDESTPRVATGVSQVPDGTPFSIRLLTSSASLRQQAAQILRDSLSECGIEVTVETWEAGDLFAAGPDGPLFGRQFELATFAWLSNARPPCDLWLTAQIPGEPPVHPYGWGGSNSTGYSNPEFDTACQAAASLLPGEAGYVENHLLAQEIFARDLPSLPLYFRIWVAAARAGFSGLIMDPTETTEMWNIEEFDY